MIEAILTEEQKKPLKEPVVTAAKKPVYSRYFIELHVPENREASRVLMTEISRHAALEFIQVLRDWVKHEHMASELSSVSVTAMGQVMIVCSHRLIDMVREQDIWAISHIRSADQAGDLRRISGKV
ncbi:MAG: hypothetical protein SFW65_08760 [Alphaproteobacteria bacterium]|nr:hypothetical protein [Alphaproteobacteria bacterium]